MFDFDPFLENLFVGEEINFQACRRK